MVRGYLGVSIQDITPDAGGSNSTCMDEHGALVGDVEPQKPGGKGRLEERRRDPGLQRQAGDGQRHLRLQVADTAPGSTVPVKILRDGKEESMNVTLKELPGAEQVAKADDNPDNSNDTLNGVTVDNLNAQVKHQLNLPQPSRARW